MGSIKKIISRENGSVLLYSLLMVFVLTMLGVSVIGLSMSNFKMGRLASEKNKAFYISDAAVEHAMWVIDDETAKAEKKAREWADGGFVSKLSGESISEENVNALVEAEFKRVYFGTLLGLDNLLDGSMLKYEPIYDDKGKKTGEKLNLDKTFTAYKSFETEKFKKESLSDDISDRINDFKYESEFGGESGNLKKISVKKSEYVISDDKDEDGESVSYDRITVSIESEGSYNKIGKALEASLDITLPEYEYTSNITYKNEIYSKAIMTRGDIFVTGANVQIHEGDMYTYGTSQVSDEAVKEYIGGIVVGYDKDKLEKIIKQNKYIEEDEINTVMEYLKLPDNKGNNGNNGNVLLHVVKGNISTRAEGPVTNSDAKINVGGETLVGTRDNDIFNQFDGEKVKEKESIVLEKGKGQGQVVYVKTKDIYIYEGDKNKLYIREGNFDVSKELPNNIEGTIFTTGNIFVTGGFNFEGSLIAGGNIIFYGEGVKHITYKSMNGYEKLSDFYIVNEDNGDNTNIPGDSEADEVLSKKSYKVNYWREAK
ncbi:hypothetical protein EAL2_c16320 [Peptoclostridium acidaminophilum DSM 3953]|uniref:Uncharacterized protein n=1 Tax=Peptoclostridium acidaminophilum DSM 3953 TaxID=1286171 RepID=W8TL43_PEPAC|nr:pilus assembly PilX N-terminal domain-containing protein [Peptoclostridium acidaminophilum]AHM56927.1 hypothetical protein EAL2_c16320 [Peptoclostridium acidaminophilum DSM 3953]